MRIFPLASLTALVPTHPVGTAIRLPALSDLAALGTVLCLYPERPGGELAGWSRAVSAEACAALDSDGMSECILFRDASGDCCWKLYLLPDSDFLAWERLSALLPQSASSQVPGIAERLLQRLAGRARHGEWRASVLGLHVLNAGNGPMLAATLASVSPLGAEAARTIARSQCADADALRDDCCCTRAKRAAAAADAGPTLSGAGLHAAGAR